MSFNFSVICVKKRRGDKIESERRSVMCEIHYGLVISNNDKTCPEIMLRRVSFLTKMFLPSFQAKHFHKYF